MQPGWDIIVATCLEKTGIFVFPETLRKTGTNWSQFRLDATLINPAKRRRVRARLFEDLRETW